MISTCPSCRTNTSASYTCPFPGTCREATTFYPQVTGGVPEAHNLDDALQLTSRIPPARLGSIEVRPVRELPPRD